MLRQLGSIENSEVVYIAYSDRTSLTNKNIARG
jgi:hypothetical protein